MIIQWARGFVPQREYPTYQRRMSHIIEYLTIDRKGRTTRAREMRKQLGITPGVQLRIEQADNGAFETVPAVSIAQDQLFYHSPEGRARLERAEEDIRRGRVTRTRGPAEAQDFLDALKSPVKASRSKKR